MLLEKINSPKDIKNLSLEELNEIAKDIRKGIINRVNKIGGHLGPDLGIVEATIAMHYVFNSPVDKFVFDVSHQCYPHKMLTGRQKGFFDDSYFSKISGYTNPKESEHDIFSIGHTSTSISLACGLAKARDLKNENYNVLALIGDGSLSGGEALEGLNNASTLNSNFIIIINDNEMSIAQNQGGLYKNLEILRQTNGQAENNFFKTLGFDYKYVENGNDIQILINSLKEIKDINHPIVVHIHTQKGLGYKPAEQDKEKYHWHVANFLNEQEIKVQESYETITTDYLLKMKEKGEPIVAITPATPGATGFSKEFRQKMGQNYVDVAISEEHAIGLISGLAKNGAKPVLAILSSFIQRTYDQLSQDLALNNSPATILVFWGGISSADCTHLGVFDIPLISNIPNIVYLAPTNKEEYIKMLDWSVNQNDYPVAIRVPFKPLKSIGIEDNTDYSKINKFQKVKQGKDIAIIGVGNFFDLAESVSNTLNATLINPKFVSGIDKEMLEELKQDHNIIVVLEDGVLEGGFAQKIATHYSNCDIKVLCYGADKAFSDRENLDDLYEKYRLKEHLIIEDINNIKQFKKPL